MGGAVENVAGAPLSPTRTCFRMSAPAGKQAPAPQAAWPTASYFDDFTKLPTHFNGDPVIIYYAPAANTDGDSFVFFRRSDVIAAGDLFSTVSYPVIDVDKGGSVDGVIAGLNQILDLAFAEYRRRAARGSCPVTGGCPIQRMSPRIATWSSSSGTASGSDRQRADAGADQGCPVHARFDGRYGSTTGVWTTGMFVEAVYRSLQNKK